jgi:hypothetical protein
MPFQSSVRRENFIRVFTYCLRFVSTSDGLFSYANILVFVLCKIRVRDRRVANGVLAGKPEGKRPLGRSKRRQKDFVKWYFKKWTRGMDWIYLDQERNEVGLMYMR